MIRAVSKWIIFTSIVNRTINASRNGRVTLQVYDTCLQMFDVCTLGHAAHIEAIVQFLPHSDQHVKCDGLHRHGNSVLQIRYAQWIAHAHKTWTPALFFPCGKFISACIFQVVMVDWNHSNHFDTPCILCFTKNCQSFLLVQQTLEWFLSFKCRLPYIVEARPIFSHDYAFCSLRQYLA